MIQDKTRIARIKRLIEANKYLKHKKYHKNNITDVAHWSSTVRRTYKCSVCKGNNPRWHVLNKRITHDTLKRVHHGYFCQKCYESLIKLIGSEFKVFYCP